MPTTASYDPIEYLAYRVRQLERELRGINGDRWAGRVRTDLIPLRSSASARQRLGTKEQQWDAYIGIADSSIGYRVSGAATSGNVLRGDGTNFVSATLATSDLSDGTVMLKAYKTADENVASSTTVQADDHLTLTLAASTKYHFRFFIFTNNAGAAEGFRCTVNGTVTVNSFKAQITIFDDTLNSMAALTRITTLGTEVAAGLGAGDNFTTIDGTIETNASGTFELRWAQNVSGADNTTVQRGSSLVVTKVG